MKYFVRAFRVPLAALTSLLVVACASAPPPAPPPPPPPPVEMPFEAAALQAADALLAQVVAAAAMHEGAPGKLLVDPMLEVATGQQTVATQSLEARVAERVGARKDLQQLPFDAATAVAAQYVLNGTIGPAPGAPAGNHWRIDLALTDLRSGKVVAHADALALGDGIDRSPLPYFRDSPVLVKDAAVDAYVRNAALHAGDPADPYYLQHIAAAASIDEATRLYDAGRYPEALAQYRRALQSPSGGEQMRALNGAYISAMKVGRPAEAEGAFAKVVAAGITYHELGLKLLFMPGKTDFWADARVSGPYAMWLRQIARQAETAKACLDVVGHTSATGSEEGNQNLSLQRANVVRTKLTREAAALAPRIKTTGMGSRQNIIGSATDNIVDALDRRVEFKIVGCS